MWTFSTVSHIFLYITEFAIKFITCIILYVRRYEVLEDPLVFNIEEDPSEQYPFSPADAEYQVGLLAAIEGLFLLFFPFVS